MYEYSAMYSQFLAYILIPLYYICALYNCDNCDPLNINCSILTLKKKKARLPYIVKAF